MALSDWLPLISTLAVPLLTALGGYAVVLLRKHGIDTMYFETVARAGGVAYSSLLTSGRPATDPDALQAAAQAGARYLIGRIPDMLASKGVQPGDATQIVGAELGKLLAADPATAIAPAAPPSVNITPARY